MVNTFAELYIIGGLHIGFANCALHRISASSSILIENGTVFENYEMWITVIQV